MVPNAAHALFSRPDRREPDLAAGRRGDPRGRGPRDHVVRRTAAAGAAPGRADRGRPAATSRSGWPGSTRRRSPTGWWRSSTSASPGGAATAAPADGRGCPSVEGVFEEVRIQGVGVIDDAVLELSPGLNVVTGETGAGKTMVVSGLGLLLGMRADSGLVRAGRRSAVVEGVVRVPEGHPALVRAEEAGADVSDGLLLARTVGADGRSRAHVGGRSTPVGVLAEIGRDARRGPRTGRPVAAPAGRPAPRGPRRVRRRARRRPRCTHTGRRSTRCPARVAERDRLRQLAHERAREIDVLQAGPRAHRGPRPAARGGRRAPRRGRAARPRGRPAAGGRRRPTPTSSATTGMRRTPPPPVADALSAARAALSPVTDHDAALRELEGRVAELAYLASDLAADLSSYLADVDVDPARLAEVQQRRADLSRAHPPLRRLGRRRPRLGQGGRRDADRPARRRRPRARAGRRDRPAAAASWPGSPLR